MSNEIPCLTRSELKSFLLGKLPHDFADQISQHLDECNACEDTVVGLEQTSDSLVALLQNPISDQNSARSCYDQNSDFDLAVAAAQQVSQLQRKSDEHSRSLQRIGDYEILSTIGRGGMGSVFKARHLRLEKLVAIKVLPHRKMRSPDSVARFNREMKIIGQMAHPAVATAFDAGEDEGTHYLVMELIDGVDLGQIVRLGGPLRIEEACELVRQAAIAVQYAHDQGVVHRDVKPSNLMLNVNGEIKLLDLGLATLGSLDGTVDELTTVGQLMGTLDYMAPEQCGGHEPVTFQSDIYSLASTLYKLLTGTSPYSSSDNDTPLKKLRAMACSDPVPIQRRLDSIPHELAAIIDRGLATDPALRFPSATAFAKALEAFSQPQKLGSLLEKTRRLRQEKQRIATSEIAPESSPPLKTLAAAATTEPNHVPSAKPSSRRSSWFGGIARTLLALAFAGGLIWGGIVLYLNTSMGQLVIESEVDDIKVTLLRNDKPTQQLIVEHESQTTRLFAGEYRVEIEGDSDSMVVENGEFQLRRGGVVVVRIREEKAELATENRVADVDSEPLQPMPDLETSTDGSIPTYQGKSLERWVIDSINHSHDATFQQEAKKAISRLQPLTDVKTHIQLVKELLKENENELSAKTQLGVIRILAPFATDDQIAGLLMDYSVKLNSGEFGSAVEKFSVGKYESTESEFKSALLYVSPFNPSALTKRINELVRNDDPRLRGLAVHTAIKISDPGKVWWTVSDFEFEFEPFWIDALMEAVKGQDENLQQNAASMMRQKFPNEPRVVEFTISQNDFAALIELLWFGCKDDSLVGLLLDPKFQTADSMANIWSTALNLRFTKDDSRLLNEVFNSLMKPDWGNEVFEDVTSELLQQLKTQSDGPLHLRIASRANVTPRQLILSTMTMRNPNDQELNETVKLDQDVKPYGIPSDKFEQISATVERRMNEVLQKQFQLKFDGVDESLIRQTHVLADLAISGVSFESDSQSRPPGKTFRVRLDLYHGKNLDQWFSELENSADAETLEAIAVLAEQAPSAREFALKMIPLFRDVSFDGLKTGKLSRKAKAGLAMFPIEFADTTPNRKTRRLSKQTKFIFENIDNFQEEDSGFLLAVLSQCRAAAERKEYQTGVANFLDSCFASEDDRIIRRGIDVALDLRELRDQNARFTYSKISPSSESVRKNFQRFLHSNPSANALLLSRTLSSGHGLSVAGLSKHAVQMSLENPSRIMSALSPFDKLSTYTGIRRSPGREFWLETPNFLSSLVTRLLAESPDYLDQSHAPENYDMWDDVVLEPVAESDESMLEYIVTALDEGKCRLSWSKDMEIDDRELTRQAVVTLKEKAKSATGPLSRKLERVLESLKDYELE